MKTLCVCVRACVCACACCDVRDVEACLGEVPHARPGHKTSAKNQHFTSLLKCRRRGGSGRRMGGCSISALVYYWREQVKKKKQHVYVLRIVAWYG